LIFHKKFLPFNNIHMYKNYIFNKNIFFIEFFIITSLNFISQLKILKNQKSKNKIIFNIFK
jgi:hypothetical protein